MNGPGPDISIWKRPLRGPALVFAWFTTLGGTGFAVIFCFGLVTKSRSSVPELALVALVISIFLAGLAFAALLFFRWVSSSRNFRRFLAGLACCLVLFTLVWVLENWRGRHTWERHRRQSEARGELFGLAALIPRAVPDAQNFALAPLLKPAMDFTQTPTNIIWRDTNSLAHLYRISAELPSQRDTDDHLVLGSLEKGTFADLSACQEFYRGNTNYPQPSTRATPAEAILVALGKFAPELQELREAAVARPYSRFPIQYDFEPPWAILLPHLAHVKRLTLLTHVRATAELDAGPAIEAFEDLKLGLRLSDSLRDEPLLIDHLVRIATLGINLQTIREGLARRAWSETQLEKLETYLNSVNVLAEYKHAMRGERAFNVSGLDYMRRQGLRPNAINYLVSEEGGSGIGPGLNLMPSGWYYQNMLTISRMHQDFTLRAVDERANRVYPEVSTSGERALQEMRAGPYTIFAKLLMPALGRAVLKSARMQTYVDATRLACALERYRLSTGGFAETLTPLVPRFIESIPNDVIDGKPLRYRRLADSGYVLYSVGWNQTDDGGVLAWKKENKQTSVDASQGDWVWQMAAR